MDRAKKVYRRLLGKKPKKYAYSPTGSLPPSPIEGRSPGLSRRSSSLKRSRMSLNRMWRRSKRLRKNLQKVQRRLTTVNPFFCRSCPASLEASLTRAVLDEAKSTYLSGSTFAVSMPNDDCTDDANVQPAPSSYKSLSLLQSVTSTVNQVCKKLKLEEKSLRNVRSSNNRVLPSSVHAVKNGRRKMEDRHVLIHDLNAISCDNSQVSKAF